MVSEDRVLRGELARVLTKQNWEIFCFADWEYANVELARAAGGILVTDHSWRRALEAASQLDPPALVVAVCDGPREIEEARNAGVYDTIVRPFEVMEPAWTVACAWHFAACQAEARTTEAQWDAA